MLSLNTYQHRLNKLYGNHAFKILSIIKKNNDHRSYLKILIIPNNSILIRRSDRIHHLSRFLKEDRILANPKNFKEYYQERINLKFPNEHIKVIKPYRKVNGRLFLKVYIPFHHQIREIRCDSLNQLKIRTASYHKVRLKHYQKVLDNYQGVGNYTIIKEIIRRTHHNKFLIRHNTPECGYHVSIVDINQRDNTPCSWCGRIHSNSLAYYRFKVGEITNGEYSCLSVKRNYYINGKGKSYYKILLRHNNQSCNYYTFWVESSQFLKQRTTCKRCADIKNGIHHLNLGKKHFYQNLFKRSDNRNGQYFPAEQYRGHRASILWWHMTKEPHLFEMTPEEFEYRNGKCPYQNSSVGEYITIHWLNKLKLKNHRDYIYGLIISKGTLKGKHIDIAFKYLPIWIEIDGIQHIIPWGKNVDEIPSLIRIRCHDRLKSNYASKYHKKLIRINAYQICKTGYCKSIHGKALKKLIITQLNEKLMPLLKKYGNKTQLNLF